VIPTSQQVVVVQSYCLFQTTRQRVIKLVSSYTFRSGKGILEIIREQHILTEQQIADLLDPAKLTNLDKNAYLQKGAAQQSAYQPKKK